MAQTIRDVMTANPIVCDATSTLREAAQLMRDEDIGDVLVQQDGQLCGLVTDRDIVVRAIADAMDPKKTPLAEICSRDVASLPPTASVSDAVQLMRDRALRRVPVVENGHAVGIVSIGDLAQEQDRTSALADISSAPPNS